MPFIRLLITEKVHNMQTSLGFASYISWSRKRLHPSLTHSPRLL